ncbi:hypothetical protein PN457_13015 [Anabaenopsis arnoldii]|uniref:Secreted protein n=1 Tax=Anabaenopsis arnoldii TaxID=2152938 RepID=A0ABT5AUH9_9CYAN|nr:hypothetical protein [Anabaenopsis arnoldii]
MHNGLRTSSRFLILYLFWFQPISLIWLVLFNDASNTSLLTTHGYFARRVPVWATSKNAFSSVLYGLMASRYRKEDAVTLAPRGWDSHPHEHTVIRVWFFTQSYLPSLSISTHLGRTNRTNQKQS